MTKSLSIFNELLSHKKEERDHLLEYKEQLMLSIKHVKEETFAHRAIQANFIRQANFNDAFVKRHQRGNFFQEKEKREIVDVNPEVSFQIIRSCLFMYPFFVGCLLIFGFLFCRPKRK